MELPPARHAPHVGGHVVALEQGLGREGLAQDRPAGEKLRPVRPRLAGRPQPVQPPQDALARPVGHRRHRVGLVLDRQVVEHALAVDVHAAHAVLDDDGQLVGVGRVVGEQVGHRAREQVALAVLVLQPLAREGRPPRRAADQEPPAARVGGGPDEVADALQPEHRVEDEERNGVDAAGRVRGPRRDERRHRPRLGDALLENLPVLALAVVEQRRVVDRLVELPRVRVDAHLPEQRLHAERPRLVGHDGHDQLADDGVAQQAAQQPREPHGQRRLAPAGARVQLLERLGRHLGQGRGPAPAHGNGTPQGLAAAPQVGHLGGAEVRRIERQRRDLVVRQGDAEPVAERAQLVLVQLLLLVGDVAALAALAEPVALDGAGEDDGGAAAVGRRRRERRVDLGGVVPPEPQLLQLAVGQVVHAVVHAGPEVVADVGARLDGVPLVLPVHRLAHAADELPVAVAGEQRVPVASPDDLDGVPPRPAERRLELLDDLPVPAHRPVEPLQVAVDDEDQVVELLARGQRDGPQRLGLVGLAVAHEHPHLGVGRRQQSPVFEVPLEPGLVDAHDRPEPHRHGGELPEVGHQPRVRVRRQARPPQLAPEALELPGGDAAFQVGAGVDPRRRVTLVVDEVGGLRLGGGPEEVVEPHLVEGRGRRVGRDVPADAVRLAVGAHHHRQRVPADEALQPLLEVAVAGIGGVLLGRDGVDVGRVRGERELHPRVLRPAGQLLQQPPGRGRGGRGGR